MIFRHGAGSHDVMCGAPLEPWSCSKTGLREVKQPVLASAVEDTHPRRRNTHHAARSDPPAIVPARCDRLGEPVHDDRAWLVRDDMCTSQPARIGTNEVVCPRVKSTDQLLP